MPQPLGTLSLTWSSFWEEKCGPRKKRTNCEKKQGCILRKGDTEFTNHKRGPGFWNFLGKDPKLIPQGGMVP